MQVVIEETVVTRYFMDVEEDDPLASAVTANQVIGSTCDLMGVDQELESRSLTYEVWSSGKKIAEFDSSELPDSEALS